MAFDNRRARTRTSSVPEIRSLMGNARPKSEAFFEALTGWTFRSDAVLRYVNKQKIVACCLRMI